MPIVRSVDSVHIEYTIPSDIKILITDDFLNEFLYQLIRITGISPYDFADDGIDIRLILSKENLMLNLKM